MLKRHRKVFGYHFESDDNTEYNENKITNLKKIPMKRVENVIFDLRMTENVIVNSYDIDEESYLNKKIKEYFPTLNFTKANYDYHYIFDLKSFKEDELYGYWDNLGEILKFNNYLKRSSLKISDIIRIDRHFLSSGYLNYVLNDKDNSNFLYIRIEDCFSIDIFILIRNYLFENTLNKSKNLCQLTKYMEIFKFYTLFKSKLTDYSSFSDLIRTSEKFSRTFENANTNDENSFLKFNDIIEIFRTSDNKIGVTIKLNNILNHLTIEEYKMFCSANEKLKIEAFINDSSNKIIPIKLTMRLKIHEQRYLKMNFSTRKKFLEKLRYKEKIKENNDYFLGINSICKIFSIHKFRDIFKHIPINEQIQITNKILSEHNKILVQINNEFMIVKDFISICKGQSIIILTLNNVDLFSFGVVDKHTVEDCNEELEKYLHQKLFIQEYQIKDLNANFSNRLVF